MEKENASIFIDGENVSQDLVRLAFKEIFEKEFNVKEKKVYFAERVFNTLSKKWKSVILDYGIKVISVTEYKKGKNSCDIKIAIDIISNTFENNNTIIIISSDTDFIKHFNNTKTPSFRSVIKWCIIFLLFFSFF